MMQSEILSRRLVVNACYNDHILDSLANAWPACVLREILLMRKAVIRKKKHKTCLKCQEAS